MDPHLLDDLANQIPARAAVDRHPAERAHEAPKRASEQAVLADEADPAPDRVDRAEEHEEVPIAGMRRAENDHFAIGRKRAVRGPAAAAIP